MREITQTMGSPVLSLEICWIYAIKITILFRKEMWCVWRFNHKILELLFSNHILILHFPWK